ncbi:MAG: SGNH/GDSL hydrolase family protein [Flavobacterium sp.]|nr:MAG: SGNH/GDSL hydrolase family protein [Flavobacterium sp.]
MKYGAIFFSLLLILACGKKSDQAMTNNPSIPNPPSGGSSTNLTYLALGDSYTIGEAVEQEDSFPYQLAAQLKANNLNVAEPKIIARTGWTTSELQTAIKAENVTAKYDIVTLLIGVNNQYRGDSQTQYKKEFIELLNTAIAFAKGDKKKVFVVSIPDWGVTPFAKQSGRNAKVIAEEIDAFNAINRAETQAMGISYTDITPGSRNAATDATLIANDGLHPSGKMYLDWAKKVAPSIVSSVK